MKSLHKLDEIPLDVSPASLTSGTFSTASTTTSTRTNSSANNNAFYIKCSIELAGLNKLETHSTNPDIASL